MKKIAYSLVILFACVQLNYAQGPLSVVYINPNQGSDSNSGAQPHIPVQTWDKALSLAANNATIYVTGGSIVIAASKVINGNANGATGVTVAPYTDFTGALFSIASGAIGTFSNLTLQGTGTPQTLLSVNNGGTLEIGSSLHINGMGQISMDGGANAINLTATPVLGMNYRLSTTYTSALDEGRAIVNATGIINPLNYFTLIAPLPTGAPAYTLGLDGSTIRLYELAVGGIYLDPINGSDNYSGAKSNRPVKTLAKAFSIWTSRNTSPNPSNTVTDIYVLSRITISGTQTLDNGIKLTRFQGDTDRSTQLTDNLIVYSDATLIINNATIFNGTITGVALHSESNGTLTLNNQAKIESSNTSNVIENRNSSNITMNAGASITSTGAGNQFCINNYGQNTPSGSVVSINGGTITTTGNVLNNNYSAAVINNCSITANGISTSNNVLYNNFYSTLTIGGTTQIINNKPAGYTITNYWQSELIVNGGTINGGVTTAIYNRVYDFLNASFVSTVRLNGGTVTSTNTTTGTIENDYALSINGQNAAVTGIINMKNANLEEYYITMLSAPASSHTYNIRVANDVTYAALVRSNPAIDLGPHFNANPSLSRFVLEPKTNYELIAYGHKGNANRDIMLFNPNGIYVNDFGSLGNNSNSGTTPASPVKTLSHAASLATGAKRWIYICDTTYFITGSTQLVSPLQIDTIQSFGFRTHPSDLIRISAGSSLTLQDVAVYAPSSRIYYMINVENTGTLILNSNASIFTNSKNSNSKYGVYLNGGSLTMEDGSRISDTRTTSITNYSYGIYKTGPTSYLWAKDGAIIEKQGYIGVHNYQGTADIDKAIFQNNQTNPNVSTSTYNGYSFPALYVNGGTVNLNGTIMRDNAYHAISIWTSSSTYPAVVNMTNGTTITNTTWTPGVTDGLVYINNGGRLNLSDGTISVGNAWNHAIAINHNGTGAPGTSSGSGRLELSNNAMITGSVYCSSPYYAPVILSQTLISTKRFNIDLADNMGNSTLVDGTNSGTFPSSPVNFTLNPSITSMSLGSSANGRDVIVNSNAIYLDGVNGNDNNSGLSAQLAVRTFKQARAVMQGSFPMKNIIVVMGQVSLNTQGEISQWDLSFNTNAVVQRGAGFTGHMVSIPSSLYHLELTDIILDGNRDNVSGTGTSITYYAIISNNGGMITINPGAVIRNNYWYGVYNNNASCYIKGGLIMNNGNNVNTYDQRYRCGIVCYNLSSTNIGSNEFIMEGGIVSGNFPWGIYSVHTQKIKLSGGEIKQNDQIGLYCSNPITGIMEIEGTAKITENNSSGIQATGQYLDRLQISGGEISNNGLTQIYDYGAYIYANNVSITGGTVSGNPYIGLFLSASSTSPGSHLEITGMNVTGNQNGINISNYSTMNISGITIENSYGSGVNSSGLAVSNTAGVPGTLSMTGGIINNNNGYGISLNNYLTYSISGNTQITNNKYTGIYSNSYNTSSISGDVMIKGNRTNAINFGGGLTVNQGIVNISGNVTFEADTCSNNNAGGGIYVAAAGNVVISGNVQIKDCRNNYSNTSILSGGSAIFARGALSMTGGSITGCETLAPAGSTVYGYGTVYVVDATSNVRLTNVKIRDNKAGYGGAIYVGSGGRITLDADTITNNETYQRTLNPSTTYTNPASGAIHLAGGVNGRLALRDKFKMDSVLYIATKQDTVYVDEALLFSNIGDIHLLANNNGNVNSNTLVTQPGTVVVSPNGTTITDASQFLIRFTLMNSNTGRGLDKGGTDNKHIMIVNQFFIDGTKSAGNGSSPDTPFNDLAQTAFSTAILEDYTTVWISGPVETKGSSGAVTNISQVTHHHVNLRRYTGFAVAAQPYPAYDSVLITVRPTHTLNIQGGNTSTNVFTISGEGGSSLSDASIFKVEEEGTLSLGGYIDLFNNPTGGNGGAINQGGMFNLSGNVTFNVFSSNTIYLPYYKVINITGPLTAATPESIGITVETSPTNTHTSGRVVATGTTGNIPAGTEGLFRNELTPYPKPIGRRVTGGNADLLFYLADRNVAGTPVYLSLQDAFDASIPTDNDEVRLYAPTEESVIINKQLQYNSKGFPVEGTFTLDSIARVRLLHNLLADTLLIRATTFSNKTQLDLNGFSALPAQAAYLDLRLPANPVFADWYPVNLPFDANVADIRDVADTLRRITHRADYGVAAYSTLRRATYGIGNQPTNPDNDWQLFLQPTMSAGTGYMVTSDNIRELRFKASNLNLFANVSAPLEHTVGAAGNLEAGINYVAQPLSRNATIAGGILSGSVIQVSAGLSSDRLGGIGSYLATTVSPSVIIAPYTNYFYQAGSPGTVTYAASAGAATVRSAELAPSSTQVPAYYELRLYAGDDESQYDALFVAASDYAYKDEYEIGRDVVKMGAIGQTMQLWSVDFDLALCANEAVLEDGQADIPLFIHTPVAGQAYQLKLLNTVRDNEQLWLCHLGKPIQNLNILPGYMLEGTGSTIEDYSVRILQGITSNGLFDTGGIAVYAEKRTVVINGMQQGDTYRIYDMTGRLYARGNAVGDHTVVPVAPGAYVVFVAGYSYKVIVQ